MHLTWFRTVWNTFHYMNLGNFSISNRIVVYTDILRCTVRKTDNLHFSTDMPHRFSVGSHVAIRWRPRSNMRIASAAMICAIIRGQTQKRTYLTEGEYQLLNPCSHATTEALSNGQPLCHTHPRIRNVRWIQLAFILNVFINNHNRSI